MNNYKYSATEVDDENNCIMIPRYRASLRVGPDGKRYREVTKSDETDLVPVRSIVSKKIEKDIITSDLVSTRFKDLQDGMAIGTSFAMSFTESITQGALGLKHGGHEKKLNKGGILKAPFDCVVEEEGKWLILKSKNGKKINKYPRPDNIIFPGETNEFKEGEVVCAAYDTVSPIFKLSAMISLMKAKASTGSRYFEKESIIVSECYAYEEGEIKYVEKKGDIEVWIGDVRYVYNPLCMYYYPEGTKIKKYQRFCSGVLDANRMIKVLSPKMNDIYYIFRRQFYELQTDDQNFTELSVNTIPEEMVEMLFISLVDVEYNTKNLNIDNIKFLGTCSGIENSKSFYTLLSYGNASKIINKTIKGEYKLKDDIMTETVLGLLLNNKLDENNN
jgi:hypothetical protein